MAQNIKRNEARDANGFQKQEQNAEYTQNYISWSFGVSKSHLMSYRLQIGQNLTSETAATLQFKTHDLGIDSDD